MKKWERETEGKDFLENEKKRKETGTVFLKQGMRERSEECGMKGERGTTEECGMRERDEKCGMIK